MTSASNYPDFEYTAEQLAKYLSASDFFTIMLKNGEIINFTPNDPYTFRKWLIEHKIQDIRSEDGWLINSKK